MAFTIPPEFGLAQGLLQGYKYIFPFGGDQPKAVIVDNDTGDPIFEDGVIMRASVRPRATLPDHPLETGVMVTDHRVRQPTEIVVSMMLTKFVYRQVYSQIQNYYDNAKLVGIHLKSRDFASLAISDMPHEEDPDMYDALSIEFTLKEIFFVQPSQGTMNKDNVLNKSDANTIKQGQLSPDSRVTAVNTGAWDEALENAIKGGRL